MKLIDIDWTKHETTTVDPSPPFVNYRATIVPDGSGKAGHGRERRMTLGEAIQTIRDYAEVNGIADLKEAVTVIEERMESIL